MTTEDAFFDEDFNRERCPDCGEEYDSTLDKPECPHDERN